MKYKNLLEVAEAVFDGRVDMLVSATIGDNFRKILEQHTEKWKFQDDDHRVWFCLLAHEATVWSLKEQGCEG